MDYRPGDIVEFYDMHGVLRTALLVGPESSSFYWCDNCKKKRPQSQTRCGCTDCPQCGRPRYGRHPHYNDCPTMKEMG